MKYRGGHPVSFLDKLDDYFTLLNDEYFSYCSGDVVKCFINYAWNLIFLSRYFIWKLMFFSFAYFIIFSQIWHKFYYDTFFLKIIYASHCAYVIRARKMFGYRPEQVRNVAMILLEIYTPRTCKGDYIALQYRLKIALRIF